MTPGEDISVIPDKDSGRAGEEANASSFRVDSGGFAENHHLRLFFRLYPPAALIRANNVEYQIDLQT
jgi:hypothetical protein